MSFFLSLKAVFLLDIWTRYIGPIDCVLMPNIPSKMKLFELKEFMEKLGNTKRAHSPKPTLRKICHIIEIRV